MAKKISELTAASSVAASDLLPIVQSGVTKRITESQFAATPPPPPVTTLASTDYTVTTADAGRYLRFTSDSAKTVHFDPAEGYGVDDEYHIANRGATGDLTIQSDSSALVINAPKGGTLVLEPGDTVTVKMVAGTSSAADEADVIGSTSDAP